MEIVIGVVIYLVVVVCLLAFGRFMKDCDEERPIHKKEDK